MAVFIMDVTLGRGALLAVGQMTCTAAVDKSSPADVFAVSDDLDILL